MKHKSKTMLAVIRNLVINLSFTLLLYENVSFTCNFSTDHKTKYAISHLAATNHSNIFDVLRKT